MKRGNGWLTTLTIAVGLVYLGPILFMLIGSTKADDLVMADSGSWQALIPGDQGLQNYRDVLRRVDFWHLLFNSVLITGSIVALGLVVNSAAGYAFARLHFRGRGWLLRLVLTLMVVPFEAIAVPLFYQVTLVGLRDSYTSQILPFVANAFSIYLFYTFFLGLPRELEEAAQIDGASSWQIYRWVAVPNSRPAFATVTILTFLTSWGSYLWPLMVTAGDRVRPLSLAVANFHTLPPLQWGDIFAFGTMMVAPVLIMFLALQRGFVINPTSSGRKG